MLERNQRMKKWLATYGIKAMPKYIDNGSMRGTWRLYGAGSWYDKPELWEKLTALGFVDYDGDKLDRYSGNGGQFSIFPILKNEQKMAELLG